MMFDDFDTQIQSDEQIPDDYYAWLAYCAQAYEASEQELYEPAEEINPAEYDDWLASIAISEEELEADLEAQDRWYHETFE